jgi:hypothetical protein
LANKRSIYPFVWVVGCGYFGYVTGGGVTVVAISDVLRAFGVSYIVSLFFITDPSLGDCLGEGFFGVNNLSNIF